MAKLTEEQKKLVEDNHNLIYWFCHKYHLDIDTYYDVLAIAMCEASQTWDKERAKFSTFVITKMFTTMLCEIRRDNAIKRGGDSKTISLDVLLNTHDAEVINPQLIDDYRRTVGIYDLEQNVLDREILRYLLNDLGEVDTEIVLMKLNGYTQKDIGVRMNLSQAEISRRMNKIKAEVGI